MKPENIVITEDDRVKILDFGLAKLTERLAADEGHRTEDVGTVLGTVAYMSPEQAGGKPLDARSDIFSFGAVLYEMTTGRRAFQGDAAMSILTAILREEPKPVSEILSGVPQDLEAIIGACLSKDRALRFQNIEDVKIWLAYLVDRSALGYDSQQTGFGVQDLGKLSARSVDKGGEKLDNRNGMIKALRQGWLLLVALVALTLVSMYSYVLIPDPLRRTLLGIFR